MIPLRDVIPSRTTPVMTVAIIALNAVAWVIELRVPESRMTRFMMTYGVVPAMFAWPTVLTSMFLHGSWLHFLGNMLYLWIFGDNVEDRFGHVRFAIFYLLCGTAAALAQVAISPDSRVPTIGASGAIAGVMGAYFVMFPHSRVLTLVPLIVFWELIEVPAILFLGIWFLMQLVSGVGTVAAATEQAGGWQPLEWMASTWRSVTDPTVGFRYNITPHMVGNLLDLVFDGQSAITARGAQAPLRHYVGNLDFVDGVDLEPYRPFVGDKTEFLALAPWVIADAPRDVLRDTATRLAPGSGDALENDYLETAVWADLVR